MSTEAPLVKAVGFAFFSPEVVILFADHDKDHLYVYPPKSTKDFALDAEDHRRHVVLVRAPSKINQLAPFSTKIHRVLVFGKPEELVSLGLPLMDAKLTDVGKIEPLHRQERDALLLRIETEAIDLTLTSNRETLRTTTVPPPVRKEDISFVELLRSIRDVVGKDNTNLNFVMEVGAPSVLRIMGDIDRDQFKVVCKALHEKGGVGRDMAIQFYRWVEGINVDGGGLALGKAVDVYMDEKNIHMTPDELDALSDQFEVNSLDIQFVANSYQQILDELDS